jgi:hypothetical protein
VHMSSQEVLALWKTYCCFLCEVAVAVCTIAEHIFEMRLNTCTIYKIPAAAFGPNGVVKLHV